MKVLIAVSDSLESTRIVRSTWKSPHRAEGGDAPPGAAVPCIS